MKQSKLPKPTQIGDELSTAWAAFICGIIVIGLGCVLWLVIAFR